MSEAKAGKKEVKKKSVKTTLATEVPALLRPEWGPNECIAELKRVATAFPDNFISRDFFRRNATMSESTWTCHFGTFEEFRRQAGLNPSRHVARLEKNIAAHAASDHYRDMNAERESWGERYLRDNGKKYKLIVTASDLHDVECDPFMLRVFIDTCKRSQPDVIVLNGDIFDLPEFGKFSVDPREWDVVARIKFVHENILKPLREACPDTQIDMIEGNHEFRLLRHLADASPAMRAVLADLHGFTVSKLLGLDEFQVNYIAKGDLAAFNKRDVEKEVQKSYKLYFDSVLAHHHPHAINYGVPGWNGHHHKWEVQHRKSARIGAYQWVGMAAGHRPRASYCEGEFWATGFMLVHVNTESKHVSFEMVNVSDFAVVGGTLYERLPSEC